MGRGKIMKRRWSIACVATVAAAAGCSSDGKGSSTAQSTAESCREEFSPDKGFGYDDDLRVSTSPAGDAAPPPSPSALEEAVDACAADGADDCDPAGILTHDAALCVARGLGMPEGIEPLQAGLIYNSRHRRIVWNVENVLHSTPGGSRDGDAWTIDATKGTLLEKLSWGATP